MEGILKIIYDLSTRNSLLNINDIDKIIDYLINKNNLEKYIVNIDVQRIRSNNLASYSINDKKIIIYSNIIKKMVKDIKFNLNCNDQVTKNMYINLSILQIILHEIEHANQEKIINYNTLESFILRISKLVKQNNQVYEFNPKERFAEIKSYNEILEILTYYEKDKLLKLLITNDELQRKMRGYHYCDNKLYSPIELYFSIGKKEYLLSAFEWYDNSKNLTENVNNMYTISDSLFYGFPIFDNDYCKLMNDIITTLEENYENKIKVIK